MNHRHLQNNGELTLAAIDDVIERGGWADWLELRDRTDSDRVVAQRVLRVCEACAEAPSAQRYRLWRTYAREALA